MNSGKSVWARIQERHECGRSGVEEAAAKGDPWAQQTMRLREGTRLAEAARLAGVDVAHNRAEGVVAALHGGDEWDAWTAQANEELGRAR